ncbi:hypothetical protein Y032_0553g3353 [Ancylostoma ceylanicum]|uniref:Uncharacterized protein n=1 Tax=Ancylostoma ceylanicum TaxID=53326 RepID=A0A016WRD0_9BILA|nr:hypothetical protein Y032_0553g3353 [Ancylostoma ceylanicum]
MSKRDSARVRRLIGIFKKQLHRLCSAAALTAQEFNVDPMQPKLDNLDDDALEALRLEISTTGSSLLKGASVSKSNTSDHFNPEKKPGYQTRRKSNTSDEGDISCCYDTGTDSEILALKILGGDSGKTIPARWILGAQITVTQKSRVHQPVPTTQFGDLYAATLRMKYTNEISGVMMNLVTAAGRVDNAAIYNLIKMQAAVKGISFEEAAPTRLFSMRRSWPGGLDLLSDPRHYQQFPDTKILRWMRYVPPKMPSSFTPMNIELVVTTLDEFVAIKAADRPSLGGQGLRVRTSVPLSLSFQLRRTRYGTPRSLAARYQLRRHSLWQGLSKYTLTGTLNMELVDPKKVDE